MTDAAIMSKMTPHAPQITGEGFGGTVEIDQMMIAGALGMGNLSRPAYLLGRLKYVMDHGVLASLDRIIRGHVFQIGKFEGWNLTDDQIAGLAALSLFETLHAHTCPVCNGTKQVAAKDCERCDGVGRVPLSGRKRAALAGMPEATWRQFGWDSRAKRCAVVVQEWDAEVNFHLNRQFRGGNG